MLRGVPHLHCDRRRRQLHHLPAVQGGVVPVRLRLPQPERRLLALEPRIRSAPALPDVRGVRGAILAPHRPAAKRRGRSRGRGRGRLSPVHHTGPSRRPLRPLRLSPGHVLRRLRRQTLRNVPCGVRPVRPGAQLPPLRCHVGCPRPRRGDRGPVSRHTGHLLTGVPCIRASQEAAPGARRRPGERLSSSHHLSGDALHCGARESAPSPSHSSLLPRESLSPICVVPFHHHRCSKSSFRTKCATLRS